MRKLVVWIFNCVVVLMAILAISCNFIGPVWEVNVKYSLSAEELKELVLSSLSDVDFEVKEGTEITVSLAIDAPMLFTAVSSEGDEVAQKIVDGNVDRLVSQLKGTLGELTKTIAKQYTKAIVRDQVTTQLKNYLKTEDEELVNRKLEAAGINDEYISQQTDALLDLFLQGETSVDEVSDQVLNTIDDVYGKLKNSGDKDFENMEMSEKDRTSIKDSAIDALDYIAEEDGSINVDEYVNRVLIGALKEMNGESENSGSANGASLVAAESDQPTQSESDAELAEEVRKTIMNYLPSEIYPILSIVLTVVLALVFLSMLTWIYILIKLAFKLIFVFKAEPTVKLKLPIILGWLPFLILVCVPSIAMKFLPDLLGSVGGDALAGLSVSFASITWVALMSACVCFAISIFYIVLRKKKKKKEKE